MTLATVTVRSVLALTCVTMYSSACLGNDAEMVAGLDQVRQMAQKGRTIEALAQADRLLASMPRGQRMALWTLPRPLGGGRLWHAVLAGGKLFSTNRSAVVGVDIEAVKPEAKVVLSCGERENIAYFWSVNKGRDLLVATDKRLALIDPATGRETRVLHRRVDYRFPPVMMGDEVIVCTESRLRRLTWTGREIWSSTIDDRPTRGEVQGNRLFLRSRSATHELDAATGKNLWSYGGGSYCYGVAIVDDLAYFVNAQCHLAPGMVRTDLIINDGRSRAEIGRLSHNDLLTGMEPSVRTGELMAMFRDGRLLKTDCRKPADTWTARLRGGSAVGHNWSCDMPRRVLRNCGSKWIALDARHRAHVLDPGSGVHREVCLVDQARSTNKPICAPWLVDARFIVATEEYLAAWPAGPILASREPLELRLRLWRGRLLGQLGRREEAQAELATMESTRPYSAAGLELRAEILRAAADTDGETTARLGLMRQTGAEQDARLARTVGLVRRVDVGTGAGRPLVLGDSVYVGTRTGRLHRFALPDLKPMKSKMLDVGVVTDPVFFDDAGGWILFGTADRHMQAVSPDLEKCKRLPARSGAGYVVLGPKLYRYWPAIPYVRLAVVDMKTSTFGPDVQIDRSPHGYVEYRGCLFFNQPGGGTASFDANGAHVHPPVLGLTDFGVKNIEDALLNTEVSGPFPIAYGTGGVFRTDGLLRPAKPIIPTKGRVFAAAANDTAIVTLTRQPDSSQPWLLEAWSIDGSRKLALEYSTYRYSGSTHRPPRLVRLGEGFLLIGRELLYVEPNRRDPLWRFPVGGPTFARYAAFSLPVIAGGTLLITHEYGELLAFDLARVTGRNGSQAAP